MIRYETKYSDELMHHGIPKQRWGVRHGPPYPLDKKVHKAVVKGVAKANTKGIFKTFDKGMNKDDDRTTPSLVGFSNYDAEVTEDTGFANMDFTETKRRHRGEIKFNPNGDNVFPPVATVIKDAENRGLDTFHCDPGFDGVEEDINPDYGTPGTTNNCMYCGAATALRGKGFDVIARKSMGGAGAGKYEDWFKGAKNEYCESWDEMEQDIKKDGNGSSGVLQGFYGDGLDSHMGGHTLNWVNENGNVTVIDSQDHSRMSWNDMKSKYGFGSKGCIRTRLDNCEPNWDSLAEDGAISINTNKPKYKDMTTTIVDELDKIYDEKHFNSEGDLRKQYLRRNAAWLPYR